MTALEQDGINHVLLFVAAFVGGYFAVRAWQLIMKWHKHIKDERIRLARLDWFKRRDY
jgi:hypothetical protein